MPLVNTYYSKEQQKAALLKLTSALKQQVADLLTCGDIQLKPNEISVRLIQTPVDGMIGKVEFEIFAHAFDERVQKQDKICFEVRKFVMQAAPELGEVRAWLVLSELGHSWD